MGGFGAKVDLGVISVTVEVQVEVAEYLTKGEDVDDEEEGAEYGALGNALSDCGCSRGVVVERDEVGSVGKVGTEPAECRAFNAEVFESGEQDVMVHCIEGCAQVEEDEDVEGTSVSRGEEVVEDFEESSFCAMEGAKARLEGFK